MHFLLVDGVFSALAPIFPILISFLPLPSPCGIAPSMLAWIILVPLVLSLSNCQVSNFAWLPSQWIISSQQVNIFNSRTAHPIQLHLPLVAMPSFHSLISLSRMLSWNIALLFNISKDILNLMWRISSKKGFWIPYHQMMRMMEMNWLQERKETYSIKTTKIKLESVRREWEEEVEEIATIAVYEQVMMRRWKSNRPKKQRNVKWREKMN